MAPYARAFHFQVSLQLGSEKFMRLVGKALAGCCEYPHQAAKLTLLGLELDADTSNHLRCGQFILGVVGHFKHLREANGTPNLRLAIQKLILGRGTTATQSDAWVSGTLHELTDLSKLRSLTIFNEGRPTWHRP
jgi:hypothetical protein